MKYRVFGGHYSDFTFSHVEDPVEFGPFDSYQAALDVWKKHMWLNVDDGQYRLEIGEQLRNQTLTVEIVNDVSIYRHPNCPGEVRAYRRVDGWWILCSDPKAQKITGVQALQQLQEWTNEWIYFFGPVAEYEH